MPWSEKWPPTSGDPLDAETVFEEMRAALAERDALVPAGRVPGEFARFDAVRGTPAGGDPPHRTAANLQDEVAAMLELAWPLRWWDAGRVTLYTLANLCQDAFGAGGWTVDLAADPPPEWPPAAATVFEELYRAVNRLDALRIVPSASESVRRDSVYRLTFGIDDWPADRADSFALFDGADDGASVASAYDVGMGGEVADDGSSQQWLLESREFRMTFASSALAGVAVRQAWVEFTTEAPTGGTDFVDTFLAEVVDASEASLETFYSDDAGPKRIAVPAGSVNTGGDTVLTVRSTLLNSDDRPAWDPAGPDYTSTYREGLAVAGPIRLIVEVDFDCQA